MAIPEFNTKKEKVQSVFRKKAGYITEQQLLRELGSNFIYGEMKVILKALLKSEEISHKKLGDKDVYSKTSQIAQK